MKNMQKLKLTVENENLVIYKKTRRFGKFYSKQNYDETMDWIHFPSDGLHPCDFLF